MVANKYGPRKSTQSKYVSFRSRIEEMTSTRTTIAQEDGHANTANKSVSSPSSRSARRARAMHKRLRIRQAKIAGTARGARPTNTVNAGSRPSSKPKGESTLQPQREQQKQHEGPKNVQSITPPPPPPTSTPPTQQTKAVGSLLDNTPGSTASSHSTHSTLSDPSESGRPSKFSGTSPPAQGQQLAKLKLRKDNLYSKLKEYETSFENRNGRPVMNREDIEPVRDLYREYLDVKAQCINCKKTVRSQQSRVDTAPEAEVSEHNSRSVGSTTAWYDSYNCGAFGLPLSSSPPAAGCAMGRITESPKEDEEEDSGGVSGRVKEFVHHANDNVGRDELKEDMLLPQDEYETFTLRGAEEYKEGCKSVVVDAPDDEMEQPRPTSKRADNSTARKPTLPPPIDEDEVVVSAVAAILDYDKRRKGSAESAGPKVEGGTVEQTPSKPTRNTGATTKTMVTPSPRRPKAWPKKTLSKAQRFAGGADAAGLEGTISAASTPSRTPMSPPVIDRTVHRIPVSAGGRKIKPSQLHPFEPPRSQRNSASAVAVGSASPKGSKVPPTTDKKPTFPSPYDDPGDIVMIPGEETSSFCKVEVRSDESISSKESSSSQPGRIVMSKSPDAAVASSRGIPSATADVFRKAQYASLPFDKASPNDGFISMASNSLMNKSLDETGPFEASCEDSAQIADAAREVGLNTNHYEPPGAPNLLQASGQDKTPDRMQPSPENKSVNGEDESPTCVSSLTVPKEHTKNDEMPLMPLEKLASTIKVKRRTSNSTFSSVETPPSPNFLRDLFPSGGLDCAAITSCAGKEQSVSPVLPSTESIDDDVPSMARIRQPIKARAATNDKKKALRTSEDPSGRISSRHYKPSDDDIGSISDGELEVPDSRTVDKIFTAESGAVVRQAAGFSSVSMYIGDEEDCVNSFVVDIADKNNKAAPSLVSEEMTEITLDATFDDLPLWTKMVDEMMKSIDDGSIYEKPPTKEHRKTEPAVAAVTIADDSEGIPAGVQKDAGESKLALALQELDALKNDFASISEELDLSKARLKRLESVVEEKDEIISLLQLERNLAQADVKHLREEIHRLEQSSRAKGDEERTDIPCTSPSCTTCDAKDKEIQSLRAALEEAKKKSDATSTVHVPKLVPHQMTSDAVYDSVPSDEDSGDGRASRLYEHHISSVTRPVIGETEVSVDVPSTQSTHLTSDSKDSDGSRRDSITVIIPDNTKADESKPSDDTEVRNALISQFKTRHSGKNRALALDICRKKHPEKISSHSLFDEVPDDEEETPSDKDNEDIVNEALAYFHSFAIDMNRKKDEEPEESEDKDTSKEKVHSRHLSIAENTTSSSTVYDSHESEDGSSSAADEIKVPLKDVKGESSVILEETDNYGGDSPKEVAQSKSKDLVELFRATSNDLVEGAPTDEEDIILGERTIT